MFQAQRLRQRINPVATTQGQIRTMQEARPAKFKLVLFGLPAVVCLLLPLLLLPLATREAVSPEGTGLLEFYLPVLFVLLFLLLLAVFFISAGCQLVPSLKSGAVICLRVSLFCGICLIGGCFAGGSLSNRIQNKALTNMVERSKPLIAAIKIYEQKNGRPPESLQTLVPEYIPAVPMTGVGANHEYQFFSYTNNSPYGSNRWALEVYQFGFTSLIYLPQQDYSVLTYGTVVKRIGDWAYWHRG